MSRDNFVFHSALSPGAVVDTLRRTTDEERETLFFFTGRRGTRPLLSIIGTDAFKLRRRKYSSNDFARQFYARFSPEPGGTRIEVCFDLPPFAKFFMRVWLTMMVGTGALLFVSAFVNMFRGRDMPNNDMWTGLVLPLGIVFGGISFAKLGRFLGRRDEHYILEYVQETLAARMEVPPPPRTGKFRWIHSIFEI